MIFMSSHREKRKTVLKDLMVQRTVFLFIWIYSRLFLVKAVSDYRKYFE